MISIFDLIIEDMNRKDSKSKTLHAFDMDDTLFHYKKKSEAKVHVVDKTGKRVQSLTNREYNNHKLHPGHKYDFSDFRSTKVFKKSAQPIHKMIRKMKAIHHNNKNVEILTARSNMDSKKRFSKAMRGHGININKIHFRRAGETGEETPAHAKHKVLDGLIRKHGYTKVHLYDDSEKNLEQFKKLKEKHPNVEFYAHHVQHDSKTGETKIKTTKV
jgi:hydroxymethylpyrimidine pyrophosphatase-like HAD family hydrolase